MNNMAKTKTIAAKKQKKTTTAKSSKSNLKKVAVKKGKVGRPRKVVKEIAQFQAEPPKPKSNQKGYGAEDLARFKQIILEKRKEILDELEILRNTIMDSTTGEYTSENPSYSLHMEQGTDAMEREKTFLLASREGKFLNYLDDALQRIDKGEYGRCTTCGKIIEKERLEAVPHAQMCFTCKNKTKS
jgi:DnaK suppressor protein